MSGLAWEGPATRCLPPQAFKARPAAETCSVLVCSKVHGLIKGLILQIVIQILKGQKLLCFAVARAVRLSHQL